MQRNCYLAIIALDNKSTGRYITLIVYIPFFFCENRYPNAFSMPYFERRRFLLLRCVVIIYLCFVTYISSARRLKVFAITTRSIIIAWFVVTFFCAKCVFILVCAEHSHLLQRAYWEQYKHLLCQTSEFPCDVYLISSARGRSMCLYQLAQFI